MNIDLTKDDIEMLIEKLSKPENNSYTHEDLVRRKLQRHLQPEGHSPETETKEGVVDTSKNKNWKVP